MIGSVEDAGTAALYAAYGADFIVGPTFNEALARFCNRRKLAYIPGCGSLNEIALAEEWGARGSLKPFPAARSVVRDSSRRSWVRVPGRALCRPAACATDEANLREWFSAGVACVGLGSALVKQAWVDSGDFDSIQSIDGEDAETDQRDSRDEPIRKREVRWNTFSLLSTKLQRTLAY